MDEAARISDGNSNLLNVNRNDEGRWLYTTFGSPVDGWYRESGFVFLGGLWQGLALT